MAAPAKITIRVAPTRTAAAVTMSVSGRYLRLNLAHTRLASGPLPVLTNASSKAFLLAALAEATALVTALED
jgi:hypothetical protein